MKAVLMERYGTPVKSLSACMPAVQSLIDVCRIRSGQKLLLNGAGVVAKAGKLVPVIDRPFKLADLPEAFRLFGTGDHKGKIIVTMA